MLDIYAPIHEIQGNTHYSPYVGDTIATLGVVTAIDGDDGFYMQVRHASVVNQGCKWDCSELPECSWCGVFATAEVYLHRRTSRVCVVHLCDRKSYADCTPAAPVKIRCIA